jgi:hypothetical protein
MQTTVDCILLNCFFLSDTGDEGKRFIVSKKKKEYEIFIVKKNLQGQQDE